MAYSNASIFISKVNAKSAYHRIILHRRITEMHITKVDDFVLLILRMAFDGANGLFHYPNIINKSVTDLANHLLNSY